MTAGERLALLSGSGDPTAAARLRRIGGAAAAAGALLVAYSGLATATAAVHLMHDTAGSGPGALPARMVGFHANLGGFMSRRC